MAHIASIPQNDENSLVQVPQEVLMTCTSTTSHDAINGERSVP
ncbi:hypothetical protein LINPERPRIM_LOCUS27286 [Linum perenne]